MIDPELANPIVSVRERETVGGPGVREKRRVEVDPEPLFASPVDPPGEMLGLDRVSIDNPPACLRVARVKVEPMLARNQGERLDQVGTQFVGVPRLAGIVAGDGDSAAQRLARDLESADVIALPAVERDGDLRESSKRRLDIDTNLGISFDRQTKPTGEWVLGIHHGETPLAARSGSLGMTSV